MHWLQSQSTDVLLSVGVLCQRPICRSCIAALQMQWPSQNQLWLGTGPQELHGSPVTAPSEIAGKVGLQSWLFHNEDIVWL